MEHIDVTDRSTPPSAWVADVDEVDAAAGVYLSPSLWPEQTDKTTFWHWCPGLAVRARWMAAGTAAHTVLDRGPWHLEPSLLCPECGLHGWIRGGQWTPA